METVDIQQEQPEVIFYSPHGKFKIHTKIKVDEEFFKVKFDKIRPGANSPGVFVTKDPKIIEFMREHPDYEKRFSDKPSFRAKLGGMDINEIIAGVRTSANNAQLNDQMIKSAKVAGFNEGKKAGEEEAKLELQKVNAILINQYTELNRRVMTAEGTVKKTATEEEIDKLQNLKQKLGLA